MGSRYALPLKGLIWAVKTALPVYTLSPTPVGSTPGSLAVCTTWLWPSYFLVGCCTDASLEGVGQPFQCSYSLWHIHAPPYNKAVLTIFSGVLGPSGEVIGLACMGAGGLQGLPSH